MSRVEAAYFLFFMSGLLSGLSLWPAVVVLILAVFYHHRFVVRGVGK